MTTTQAAMAKLPDERERDRAIARYGQLEERLAAAGSALTSAWPITS